MTLPRESAELARRVIWFEPPERALVDPVRFLAYLMTYGTVQDIAAARRYFSADDFRAAVEQAPPGIFDERSWLTGISLRNGTRRRHSRGGGCPADPGFTP